MAHQHADQAQPQRLHPADVEILRESGTVVAEIRELVFEARTDGHAVRPVRILGTRRVGFRDQVRPGETIYVRASVSVDER